MAFSEVYQALNSGAIDGQENTFSNFDSQKYQEVQKYLTISHHGRLDYVILTNTQFWEKLTAEQKTAFKGALQESTAYARKLADELNLKALENIKASGKVEIYTLTPEERAVLVKAMQPVYDKYAEKIGMEYIDAARSCK